MQINICFRERARNHNTTAYYEELVFDISRMLNYMSENFVYCLLEGNHAPDTLHSAIRDAKEENRNEGY